MIRVAVIGESPYDTKPLCKVWTKKYKERAKFSLLSRTIEGSALSSPKILEVIKAELRKPKSNYDVFILVRDLDTFRTDKAAYEKVVKWRQNLSTVIPKNVLLLNIQELEALLLADIDLIYREYKTTLKLTNPEMQESPKEFLTSKTKSATKGRKVFSVSHNEKLIPKLDFKKVEANCQFYREFIRELESLLGVKPQKSKK